MSHEHNGNCCGQAEEPTRHQLMASQMGHLGCTGHCHHPEHQLPAAITAQEFYLQAQFQEAVTATENKPTKNSRKRKIFPPLLAIITSSRLDNFSKL